MRFAPALCLLALFGAYEAVAAQPQPANPYGLASEPSAGPERDAFAKEDQSSPFAEAHTVEQVLYFRGLRAKYGQPGEAHTLPPDVDADGRPLWFDKATNRDYLAEIVAAFFANERFDKLEKLFDDWNSPTELRADGRWKLTAFDDGIQRQFHNADGWDAAYRRIQAWRAQSPKSRAAALAEAIYWLGYAWDARGQGFAATVTPEGWKLFAERLDKAEAALVESKAYAGDSPLWDYLYIEVGEGRSWPIPQLLEAFKAGYAKQKSFVALYSTTVTHLAPKWGGNWKLVDQFIKDAVTATKQAEGLSMYARLYMFAAECDCGDVEILRDTLATWPELKRSFEDLVRLYPHSGWYSNKFALYACLAGDKATYLDLRRRLGGATMPWAWPHNHSFDLCEHQFAATPL